MRPSDLTFVPDVTGTFRCDAEHVEIERVGTLVSMSADQGSRTAFISFKDGLSLSAVPMDQGARRIIEELPSAAFSVVSWLLDVWDDRLIIQSHFFESVLTFSDQECLALGVTDRALEDLGVADAESAINLLNDTFLLDGHAFALTGRNDIDGDFQLLGPHSVCSVRVQARQARVQNVRQRPPRQSGLHRVITLLRGAVRFMDATMARELPRLRHDLLENMRKAEGYLAHWEKYNELEKLALSEEAKRTGIVPYADWEPHDLGAFIEFVFHLSKPIPPAYFEQRWSDQQLDVAPLSSSDSSESSFLEGHFLGTLVPPRWRDTTLCVRVERDRLRQPPPKQGLLMPSTMASRIRLNRRQVALERVRQGTCPLPWLGNLLETGNVPGKDRHRIRAITDSLIEALGFRPTPKQEQALDIALNTPDIAVIQGPPGTGKTCVIRGLVHRLAEEAKSRGTSAKILVASDQHDAVDNAIERLTVAGLPPFRWRVGAQSEDNARLWSWVEAQHTHCSEKLEDLKLPPVGQIALEVDQIIAHARALRGGPNASLAVLRDIDQRVHALLLPPIADRLSSAILRLGHAPDPTSEEDWELEALRESLQDHLRRQRTEIESFFDDGWSPARRLVRFLETDGAPLQIPVPDALCQAAEVDTESLGPEQLARHFDAYLHALEEVAASVGGRTDNEDIADPVAEYDALLADISNGLHQKAYEAGGAVSDIIRAYADEIQDEEEVASLVRKYAGVIASSCQQIDSARLAETRTDFDMVVIDEAAHALPLDLLIPMSRARRIVLVGDQEQLPHILEPQILKSYQDRNEALPDTLKESLFGRLFRMLKDAEAETGVCRAAMLEDEYRMHPVIGQFVSDTFYESKVHPRSKLSERQHQLGLYDNKTVAWLDVPPRYGNDRRHGTTYVRESEVGVLLDEVEKVFEASSTKSVGIITFYKGQVNALRDGIQQRQWPESWVAPERLRVGTVDAFQGREFEVVFLSTVRSNVKTALMDRVGFVSLKNRLCVALSRAKELLVVIGDASTLVSPAAGEPVPQLAAFHSLCSGADGYLITRGVPEVTHGKR